MALLIECLFIDNILSNCAKALCLRFPSSLKGKFRLTGFLFGGFCLGVFGVFGGYHLRADDEVSFLEGVASRNSIQLVIISSSVLSPQLRLTGHDSVRSTCKASLLHRSGVPHRLCLFIKFFEGGQFAGYRLDVESIHFAIVLLHESDPLVFIGYCE